MEEIVRELAEQRVLEGNRGDYTCSVDIGDVRVPATLQSTLAARIDRLSPTGKRTLRSAAVIGSRFGGDLLGQLNVDVDVDVDELIAAELVEVVAPGPPPLYSIRHPLVRAVAYESQLSADRAQMHRRVAAAIAAGDHDNIEQNASLIAEHLENAGDVHDAYAWHVRAAEWAADRDAAAMRVSSERARRIADGLPSNDPLKPAMSIAPRRMLCGMAAHVPIDTAVERFNELLLLCTAACDRESLFIGMAGMLKAHVQQGRIEDGTRLAAAAAVAFDAMDATGRGGRDHQRTRERTWPGRWTNTERWTHRVIDIAEDSGTPAVGREWSLALAFAQRASVRYWLGRAGWQGDIDRSLEIARGVDPPSFAAVVCSVYLPAIAAGVLAVDQLAVTEIERAVRISEDSSDTIAVHGARATLGVALVHRPSPADRDRGYRVLSELGEDALQSEAVSSRLPIADAYLARERGRRGGDDSPIPRLRAIVERQMNAHQGFVSWASPATALLVEALLVGGGTRAESLEAAEAIDRLATLPTADGHAVRELWLARSRAELARRTGDGLVYGRLMADYHTVSARLGFAGHVEWSSTTRRATLAHTVQRRRRRHRHPAKARGSTGPRHR
ncbi:hypothetical protein ACWDTP_04915 [Mycobacterium sp. NPDC003449]